MPRTPEQFEEIREKTKRKIMEHSLRLFADKGYHGTSISEIAKSAGISKGLAYNYFSSKQNLVESIFEQILELGSEYEKILAEEKNPYEQLRIIIEFTFDYLDSNEEFWRLYIALALQPSIMDTAKKVVKEFGERMIILMTQIFKKIGLPNPKAEAQILGGMIDGISLNYFMDKENYPFNSVKKKMLEKYSEEELKKHKK